jgi:hypothetical protein
VKAEVKKAQVNSNIKHVLFSLTISRKGYLTMKKIVFVVALMIIVAGSAYAGSCDTISCTGKVLEIFTRSSKEVSVKLDVASTDTAVLNCTLKSNEWFSITGTEAGFNTWIAMLLTAQASGKEVRIRINEGSTDCTILNINLLNY